MVCTLILKHTFVCESNIRHKIFNMLKSEMQHQFWITKKTVQRKFGSKEDEHVISSDSQLDAKVDIYKSISASSAELSKIIDQYQERLCILSQEESLFGRFLKDAGKRSKTTSQIITSAGKAMSYCGQQRKCIRVPLVRLQHEVDVFRYRAITDMQNTIAEMEKERTEYRAALEWMKSASTELDPDTGRGLEKFRTAQTHVRNAKQLFDNLTMDSIQKIDLLAAARCNMFSHVLVSYMAELKQFALKTNTTFEAISKILEQTPKYDFFILKELVQNEGNEEENVGIYKTELLDKDQSLFFANDYTDNKSDLNVKKPIELLAEPNEENLFEISNDTENVIDFYEKNQSKTVAESNIQSNEKSSDLYSKMFNNTNFLNSAELTPILPINACERNTTRSQSKCLGKEKILERSEIAGKENKTKSSKAYPWEELFADLDPLGNLEAFDLKLSAANKNFQHT